MKRIKKVFKRMLIVQCIILQLFSFISINAFADDFPITKTVIYQLGFENGFDNWFFTPNRSDDPISKISLDTADKYSGEKSAKIEYKALSTSEQFSLSPRKADGKTNVMFDVQEGETYEFSIRTKVISNAGNSADRVFVAYRLYDNAGTTVEWTYNYQIMNDTNGEWKFLSSTITIGEPGMPGGIVKIQPVIASGKGAHVTAWIDDVTLSKIEAKNEATVTIEAAGDGIDTSKVELKGGGNYNIGEKATIKASVKQGANYVFEKWVDSNSGETVSSDSIYTFIVDENKTYRAIFKQLPKYTVEVAANNSLGTVSQSTGTYDYGATITLNATPNNGNTFVCWENNGKIVSENQTYVLTVTGNHNIKAYFSEAGKYKVIFKDVNGRVLKVESVAAGQAATAPADTSKPGYEFIGWDKEFNNITADTVVTAVYKPPDMEYIVSVENGVIQGIENSKQKQCKFDTLVTVEASDKNNFSYWKDSSCRIISYDPIYSFYVSGDVTLTAVSNDNDVQRKPIAAINSVIEGSGTVSFVAQCTVPSGTEYQIVEYGVLMSQTNSTPDLGASDVIRGSAGSKTNTGQFMITKTTASGQWYGRAYVICKDGSGNLFTIYSCVQSGTAR